MNEIDMLDIDIKMKIRISDVLDKHLSTTTESKEAEIDENTSDWYHTFKELYEHRISLFIALIKCNPQISWRANNNDDWTNREWRFVAGMHLNSWDISYHLPTDKRTELDNLGIATTLNAPKRDGYTAKDVVERLDKFVPESKEADGEWIEKCFEDFWINGWDGTNSKKTMKELFKQAILSNFPKTNDKKIDELIEKNKVDIEEFEQWKKEEEEDWNQSEVTRYKALIIGRNLAIEDLTSLKSPTTTDE